ncbi:MAG: hypothetical protein AAF685_10820 [Cyanobacteria bacterium P01_C01_bin.89]
MTTGNLQDRLGNIEQIRDVLVGPQIRDLQERMGQLESNLTVFQQETRSRIDEVQQVLTSELQAALEAIDKKNKALASKDEENREDLQQQLSALMKKLSGSEEALKQLFYAEVKGVVESTDKKILTLAQKEERERAEIGEQINALGNRLNGNLSNLNDSLDRQTTTLRDDMLAGRNKLQGDLNELRSTLINELDKRMSSMTDSKLARDDMAEMLFELGLRLKGTDFVPSLKDMGDGDEKLLSGS